METNPTGISTLFCLLDEIFNSIVWDYFMHIFKSRIISMKPK